MKLLGLKLGSLALLLVSTGVGCGRGYSAFCEEMMDCQRGNDADIEACIIELERQEEIASIYGCDDDWDRAFTCVEEESHCRARVYTHDARCNRDLTDVNLCVN
ncbi:hypothetical protein [Chondromyces crocatus]|uniref:Lipoprotein n=1 Tax=Chondromyces crocatus TaxID=52 RepID=A0A0K1EAG7_CHOCO|nr:hypothetical protein [Chondromyces crocatus]AKT37870.1 uncharacterized protein CMC5_020130 [Chondromyces crocatus]